MDTTEEAAKLLAHSIDVNKKHYRVKPEKVKPFVKK